MDPAAACVTANFSLSHFPVSEGETFFKLRDGLFHQQCRRRPLQRYHGIPVVDFSVPKHMVLIRTSQNQVLWLQQEKQFLHPRVPSASPLNCLEQLHPNSTGLTWNTIEWHSDEEWLFSPDRVTGVESLLHISKLQLVSMAADGLQNCHKAFSGKRRTL